MKERYRIIRRETGVFYLFDRETGTRQSLKTKERAEAEQLAAEKNDALRQPHLNLELARVRMAAGNAALVRKTWGDVFTEILTTKHGSTLERWTRAVTEKAFDPIRALPLFETSADQFLRTIHNGTISTNSFLKTAHNLALDMGWLLKPVLPRKHWPKIHYGPRRAITAEEHERIIGIEWLPERKAFYQLCWYFGGSQSDIACLRAEDIQWGTNMVVFARKKTKQFAYVHFSEEVAVILRQLPKTGFLFPRLAKMQEKHRASEFKRRCKRLKIAGVTLHSYRYAWAERAKAAGMPERFAMQVLGHNSKAVHRSYAKNAVVTVPALEEYEKNAKANVIKLAELREKTG